MGVLYDASVRALIGFSLVSQLIAVPILYRTRTTLT